MSDVVQSVRALLQDFIAPEFREIKTEVKRLDSKIDSETTRLEDKIDSTANELVADIRRVESKLDAGFLQLRSMLENANLRAELEATRDVANLRERVTRLEVERSTQRQ